jgi:hypothetical protein
VVSRLAGKQPSVRCELNDQLNDTRKPGRKSMTNTDDDNPSAVDVVRCVYLARTAAGRGDADAARRWQAKADAWLARQVIAEGRSRHASREWTSSQ